MALDDVLKARHTVRSFSPQPLKKEDVNSIIEAGLIAPFAMMAVVGRQDFRKFFIIPAGSPAMDRIKDIVTGKFPAYVEKIEKEVGPTPFTKMLTA